MPVPPSHVDLDSAHNPIHFRPFALRRYQNRTQVPVTLKIKSSRRLAMLWPGLLLLLASGVAVWSRAVPVCVSAQVVRAGIVDSHQPTVRLPLLLFVKAEKLPYFSPGNRVVLITSRQRLNATVIAVEPPTASPGALGERFGLPREATEPSVTETRASATEPKAIVVIQPESDAGALALGEMPVEIGERRLAGMLPLVRRIYE